MALKVLSTGTYASIQDLGRVGYRRYGVPLSGAMDQKCFRLANLLLQNEENDAAVELLLTGGKFEFQGKTTAVLTGADFRPVLNDKEIQSNNPFQVSEGDILTFGRPGNGSCCYLAVKGGFDTEIALGSRSQFANITYRSRLVVGDKLPFSDTDFAVSSNNSAIKPDDSIFSDEIILVKKGPEFDCLPEQFFDQTFSLSGNCTRMAYQVNEPVPISVQSKNMLTSSTMPGTVQLTPSGQLMILMRDSQVTGGYPRVLQLREDSISLLAQKRIGAKLRFQLS